MIHPAGPICPRCPDPNGAETVEESGGSRGFGISLHDATPVIPDWMCAFPGPLAFPRLDSDTEIGRTFPHRSHQAFMTPLREVIDPVPLA